jgi:hypothetical protein
LTRYWIRNTSPTTPATITVNSNEPVAVAPCETAGPFTATPAVVFGGGLFGVDSVGIDEGGGCGYSIDSVFFAADGSYVIVLSEGTAHSCAVPDPPLDLHAAIVDLTTGLEVPT